MDKVISTVIKSHPEIVDHLSSNAMILAVGEEAYYKAIGRDKNEPGAKQKEKAERKLAALIKRIFDRQKRDIEPQLQTAIYSKSTFNIDWTDLESNEFVALVIELVQDGINLFRQQTFDSFSDEFINVGAAIEARKYSYELIKVLGKQVNGTTLDAIRNAITSFVEVPGTTIVDVMESLPFSADRALRIAVTETTRIYAQANQIAGEELQREFPDLTVVKTWYTNVDDRVCDICGPLHMVQVPIDGTFNGYDNPPVHVNCRCWSDYGTTLGNLW